MNRPEKRYIVWTRGDSGYVPYEFDTVEECLLHEKYGSDWYLTEAMNDLTAYGRYTAPKKVEISQD